MENCAAGDSGVMTGVLIVFSHLSVAGPLPLKVPSQLIIFLIRPLYIHAPSSQRIQNKKKQKTKTETCQLKN